MEADDPTLVHALNKKTTMRDTAVKNVISGTGNIKCSVRKCAFVLAVNRKGRLQVCCERASAVSPRERDDQLRCVSSSIS